jgi:hypothetical protein
MAAAAVAPRQTSTSGWTSHSSLSNQLDEGLVQQPPGGSDEGPAGQVLFMPRLLADQHDGGSGISLAEDEGEGFISYFWKFRPA